MPTVIRVQPRALILAGAVALGLLAALVAGWWQLSPVMALQAIERSAMAGDSAALERQIDFPALRLSLKEGLKGRLAAESAAAPDRPMKQWGLALATQFVDPMVDAAVSPSGLSDMGLLLRATGQTPDMAGLGAMALLSGSNVTIQRDGLSRFTIGSPDPESPRLLFVRDGLRWRLTGADFSRRA